ncbi:MAG: hypothetical protein IJP31_08325 [Lachnospiraceae bacterium]|nr:hypothetical protein [Lachnospiraceae bacterium]
MAERIVGLISCVMCAVPYLIMAKYDVNSQTPIHFWSGDTALGKVVKNVPAYNREMAELYKKYGFMYCLSGLGCLLFPPVGYGLLCLTIAGIVLVYRAYKKILKKYQNESSGAFPQITPAYRKAMTGFGLVFFIIFILLWLPLFFAGQNSPWLIISILGTVAEAIIGMAVYVLVIAKKTSN